MNNNASLEQFRAPPNPQISFLELSKYPAAKRPSPVLANWLVGPRVCTDCITRPLHCRHQARRQGQAHPHPLAREAAATCPARLRQGLPKPQAPSGWSFQGSVSGRGRGKPGLETPTQAFLPCQGGVLETRRPAEHAGPRAWGAEVAPRRKQE